MRALADRRVFRLLADRRGVTALEYGVLLAGMFLVLVLGSQPIITGIKDFFLFVLSSMTQGT